MIKINNILLEVNKFPDKTQLLKFSDDVLDSVKDENPNVVITWLYDSDEELATLIFVTQSLKAKNIKNIYLNMPYVPNARMDRVKNADEVFTLKYFANVINWLDFTNVHIVNPHSTVSEALFDRCWVDFDTVKEDVAKVIKKVEGVGAIYYPDAGAHKKFSDMFSFLDTPYLYGEKIRDWRTGQIQGLTVMNPMDVNCTGKDVLIVDDIISYGGSMYHSAIKLHQMDFNRVYCYATHVEDSILDPERGKLIDLDYVKKIYTTNSIYRGEHEKIEVVTKF